VIGLLVFLLSLPLAVYFYAGIISLVDRSPQSYTLVRLALRSTMVFLLILATPAGSRVWILYGFVLVAVLHLSAQLILRHAIQSGRWSVDRID
jgi:hypothetical protein